MQASSTCIHRWQFPKSDCGYDDITPQPSCSHRGLHDVDALKKCCLATAGCGGFNTNGIIKKADCLSHKKAEPLCDLYVKESSPQPAPQALLPIWPAPKKYSRGNTTRMIDSSSFKLISTNKWSDPLLPAAFARYQPGLLFPHIQGPDAAKAAAMALQVTSMLANCSPHSCENTTQHQFLGLMCTYIQGPTCTHGYMHMKYLPRDYR